MFSTFVCCQVPFAWMRVGVAMAWAPRTRQEKDTIRCSAHTLAMSGGIIMIINHTVYLLCRFTSSWSHMGVSKNRGTPKSSISIGFSIIFTIHFGVPLFLETPIYIYICIYIYIISPVIILCTRQISKNTSALDLLPGGFQEGSRNGRFCSQGGEWLPPIPFLA